MTDAVADMIIRIKNGYLAKRGQVVVPASNLLADIAQLLVTTGYLEATERVTKQPQDELNLTLRYIKGKPAMTDVKRVSKPGRREYATVDQLPRVLSGFGTAVISTSQGVLTVQQAKEKKIGGEVLFKIW